MLVRQGCRKIVASSSARKVLHCRLRHNDRLGLSINAIALVKMQLAITTQAFSGTFWGSDIYLGQDPWLGVRRLGNQIPDSNKFSDLGCFGNVE